MNLEENAVVQTRKFRVLAVILIAVFCLAVGGVGGYWMGVRTTAILTNSSPNLAQTSWLPSTLPVQRLSPTPTIATGQTAPTTNWKTYRDPQGFFSIKYPSDPYTKVQYMKAFRPKELLTKIGIRRSFEPGSQIDSIGPFLLFVSVIDNVNRLTTEKATQTVLHSPCANTLKPYHNGEIAGLYYIDCFESTLHGVYRQETIEHITEDKIYQFTFNTEGEPTSGDTRTFVDQILATFKFNSQ